MAWIESHQSLSRHRKTIRTAGRLEVDRHKLIGHLHELWWWALDNVGIDGCLGDMDPFEVAMAAEWDGDAEAFVDALTEAGFIDKNSDGTLSLHDWYDYAGKLIEAREVERERSRRRREEARQRRDQRTTSGRTADDRQTTVGTVPNRTVPNRTNRDNVEFEENESKTESVPYAEIIDHLNDKAGKRYRPTTDATRRHISARWNEGHTLEDFRTVVDKKVAEWMGTDMEQYLRPQTLFGTNFESYLNAPWPGENDKPTSDTPSHTIRLADVFRRKADEMERRGAS